MSKISDCLSIFIGFWSSLCSLSSGQLTDCLILIFYPKLGSCTARDDVISGLHLKSIANFSSLEINFDVKQLRIENAALKQVLYVLIDCGRQ